MASRPIPACASASTLPGRNSRQYCCRCAQCRQEHPLHRSKEQQPPEKERKINDPRVVYHVTRLYVSCKPGRGGDESRSRASATRGRAPPHARTTFTPCSPGKASTASRRWSISPSLPAGQLAFVNDIATANNIPKKFLDAILGELRNAGFVQSRKGKEGGYRLARLADRHQGRPCGARARRPAGADLLRQPHALRTVRGLRRGDLPGAAHDAGGAPCHRRACSTTAAWPKCAMRPTTTCRRSR